MNKMMMHSVSKETLAYEYLGTVFAGNKNFHNLKKIGI
jgi:hypothetical protein